VVTGNVNLEAPRSANFTLPGARRVPPGAPAGGAGAPTPNSYTALTLATDSPRRG